MKQRWGPGLLRVPIPLQVDQAVLCAACWRPEDWRTVRGTHLSERHRAAGLLHTAPPSHQKGLQLSCTAGTQNTGEPPAPAAGGVPMAQ